MFVVAQLSSGGPLCVCVCSRASKRRYDCRDPFENHTLAGTRELDIKASGRRHLRQVVMFAFEMKTLLLVLADTSALGLRQMREPYQRLISLILFSVILLSALPPSNQVPTERRQQQLQRDLQRQLRPSAHQGRHDQDLHQITALPLVSGSSTAGMGAHHAGEWRDWRGYERPLEIAIIK